MNNTPASLNNVDALTIATAEFSLAIGALTVAAAITTGFSPFGNVTEATPKVTVKNERHIGSYRGRLTADKTVNTESDMEWTIKCDEMNQNTMLVLLGATANGSRSQNAYVNATMDTITGGSTTDLWFDVSVGGVKIRNLTNLVLTLPTVLTGTAANTGDLVTITAHGLTEGLRIIVLSTPAGPTVHQVYYVKYVSSSTFQLALTSGGSAIPFSADGAFTTSVVMTEDTDYEADLELGRIRFTDEQVDPVPVFASSPGTSASPADLKRKFTPMETPIIRGVGRVVIYTGEVATDRVILDHQDFVCDVTISGQGAFNGKNWTDVTLSVMVRGSVPGNALLRELNAI